ncbi:MAG: AAA family ATPase, partial [Nitrospirota bacterium]|nr:AAA family ATPase [Nitrospirota bacterium]
MIIKELVLKGFRRFRDDKVTLGPGFTVLAGDNEAGKSTLLEALLAVLYASPKSRARTVDEWTSWGAQERPRLTLLYESDGVEFRLEKDFEAGTASLANTATGESLTDEKKINSALAEQIGIGDRDLFLATACVRHDEIGDISSGAVEIKDRLQQVMTGSREDVSAQGVLKAVNDKIAELNRGMERPASKPGMRRILADSVTTLAQKSIEKRQDAERHWAAVESLSRTEQEIDRIQSELQSRKSLLDKNRRFVTGRERLDALGREFHEIESRLARIREIEDDRARAVGRSANLVVFASAPDALAEIARIEGAIEEFRQTEELEKARMADAPKKRGGAGRIIIGGIGLALFAAGAYLGYTTDPYLYLVAAAGAALAGYSIAGLSSRSGDEIQGLVRMRAEEMHSRAEAAEAERRGIFGRFGVGSPTELQEGYRLYQEAASVHDR